MAEEEMFQDFPAAEPDGYLHHGSIPFGDDQFSDSTIAGIDIDFEGTTAGIGSRFENSVSELELEFEGVIEDTEFNFENAGIGTWHEPFPEQEQISDASGSSQSATTPGQSATSQYNSQVESDAASYIGGTTATTVSVYFLENIPEHHDAGQSNLGLSSIRPDLLSRIICPDCPSDFTNSRSDSYARHRKEVHELGKYPCPHQECEKFRVPFKRRYKLRYHVEKSCKIARQLRETTSTG
ncbi:hypothetical protein GGI43DRAFT_394356 [Trichoderma evansii]